MAKKDEKLDVLGLNITRDEAIELHEWFADSRGRHFWSLLDAQKQAAVSRALRTAGRTVDLGGDGKGLRQKQLLPYPYFQREQNDNLAMGNAYQNVSNTPAMLRDILGL